MFNTQLMIIIVTLTCVLEQCDRSEKLHFKRNVLGNQLIFALSNTRRTTRHHKRYTRIVVVSYRIQYYINNILLY